jgi:hypothetical protein
MKLRLHLLPLIGALLFAGCSTYTQQTNEMIESARQGRVDLAAEQSLELAKKNQTGRDAIVYELEAGAAQRTLALAKLPAPPAPLTPAPAAPAMGTSGAAPGTPPPAAPPPPASPSDGAYERSLHIFDSADEAIDDYEVKAKHSVSSGVTSAVINPATTPYRGQASDKVMLSTYQAINYLQLGDTEKARASLNKAYKRQADAVAENSKRIEADKAKIEAAKNGQTQDEKGKSAGTGFDTDRAQNDPKVAAALADLNSNLDARLKAYADYVNPYTTFIDGLFMMTNASDAQEQERAAKEFERVASMADGNNYLKEDAMLAQDIARGNALPKLTYVVFETGEAPHREEVIIPVPLFLFTTNELLYTQVPISKLSFNDQVNQNLSIDCGGTVKVTSEICNMDSVIAREFKNQLTSMWVNALVCAATKAIIQHEANKAIDRSSNNALAGLFVKAALAVTNAATTRADTRSWRSLPKSFGYARFSTPESGTITVSTPDGQSKQVKLPAAKVVVVYVKQAQPGMALLADSFALR